MASPIICKLSFGDEIRRFKVNSEDITYAHIHTRAEALFGFEPTAKFKLQYKDDEEDLITMATDEEMSEAVELALASAPPILRISVKVDAPAKADAQTEALAASKAEASTPAREAAKAGPEAAKAGPEAAKAGTETAKAAEKDPVDLSDLLKSIHEQIPKSASAAPDGSASDLATLLKLGSSIGESLPKFVESLPKFFSGAASGQPNVSFSVEPSRAVACGYGDKGFHPGVTCDKSGMSPIVGARFNLKGHNYDLCEAEFQKLEPSEQAKFVKIDPPHGPAACDQSWRKEVHFGVTCDKSGMSPIVGARYNLKGHNYDLCETEFQKLEPSEQAKFVKMEAPWRPKGCGWGRHHYHHSHCNPGHHSYGGHGHGGAKLAARFVSDVSIFDGTQMAPGTAFTKIWRIKNVGETPWPAGTKLLFVGGDRMAAEMMAPFGEQNKMVMPGEEVDVAVDMVAPTELGRYLGYWRLVGPLGRRRFGQRVWCHIQVVDPAGAHLVESEDPTAIQAEISDLMAKAEKDDPDADDVDNDMMAMDNEPPATAPPSSSKNPSASAVEPLPAAASSVPSSAALVRNEETDNDDETAAALAAEARAAAATAPVGVKEEHKVAASVEAAAPPGGEEGDVATQLLQMGFEPKSVELVMEKHVGTLPVSELLEVCSRDLLQLSEWDPMFSDLEEMGFNNREKNTRLMIKNDGSVKRTVKDLFQLASM